MCGETGETISHILSECSKLAQRKYKRRHENVARMVHWKLCQKFNLEKPEKWYLHNPPDIVIVNKMEKTAIIVDVAIPGDKRITDKEKEKTEKYRNLKGKIQRLWNLKKIDVILVVLGALWSVTKNFEKYVDKIGIKINLHAVHKTTLLGTARILRKMLEC